MNGIAKCGDMRIEVVGIDRLEELLDWRMKVIDNVFGPQTESDKMSLREANRFYYLENIPTGKHVAVFAVEDGEVVGCGGVCFQTEMPSPENPWCECAYLMNIYVEPAWRNRNVGSCIVRSLIADAHAKGIKKIYLETSECGRHLYEKIGFVPMKDMMVLQD